MKINKPKLTKYEFSQICEKIENIIYKYFDQSIAEYNFSKNYEEESKVDLEKRRLTFFLSNGEILSYYMGKNNLAHLLGFNIDYLISKGIYDKTLGSFEILKKIVINPDTLYRKYEQGLIDIEQVVSPFVDKKLRAFESNAFINLDKIHLICKYDENRAYGFNKELDASYLIVQEIDDKYYLYILSHNNKGEFIPVSSQLYENYEELYNYLSSLIMNQELVIATGLNIKQGYLKTTKLWLDPKTKYNKTNLIKNQAKEYQCVPNVLNDYFYMQEIVSAKNEKTNANNDIISQISSIIREGKTVDLSEIDSSSDMLNPGIINLINSYNDSLFEENKENNKVSFSNIQNENAKLKVQLDESLKKYEELISKYNALKKDYSDLNDKANTLENKIEEVKKVLN